VIKNKNRTEAPARWSIRRLAKYLSISLLVGVFIAALLDIGLAWGYIWFLMHPGCPLDNQTVKAPAVEVWLQAGEGRRLMVWYSPPQNGAVVIALGGLEGALGGNLPPVHFLIERGYGALQIGSRACARPPLPVTLGAREADEVAAALEFLQAQREVQRVGIMGYSMGAAAAIRSAARYAEIEAVVAEGGYFNLGEDIVETGGNEPLARRIFYYTIAGAYWLQSGINPWEISPIEDLPAISPRAVLLIYGEHEASSGRAEAQYAAALEPRFLWIVPGGTHGGNYRQATQEYERRVLEFFDQTLTGNNPMVNFLP